MMNTNSHSFELGWLEGCAKRALIEVETENYAEAIKQLRVGLDEAQRKASFEREQKLAEAAYAR